MNPVLWRELRVSARTPRVGWMISGGLWLCLGAVALMAAEAAALAAGQGLSGGAGRLLVGVLLLSVAALISVAAPLLCARGLLLERRRETFDVLIITPITARDILRGKLIGALMPLFVILGATLPLAMILRLYGGFTAVQVLLGYVFLFLETVLFGLLGLAVAVVSAEHPRRGMVTLAGGWLFLMFGTPAVDLWLTSAVWWWIKLPIVAGVALWLVADTARRLTAGARETGDFSAEVAQAILFLVLIVLLVIFLAWDISDDGPTLRYLNPLLAFAWFTAVPVGVPPAAGNFIVSLGLYLLLPGAIFPALSARLQRYFHTSHPHERGLFF